jgi:hypothetical protein
MLLYMNVNNFAVSSLSVSLTLTQQPCSEVLKQSNWCVCSSKLLVLVCSACKFILKGRAASLLSTKSSQVQGPVPRVHSTV